jgi:hypothetical protein
MPSKWVKLCRYTAGSVYKAWRKTPAAPRAGPGSLDDDGGSGSGSVAVAVKIMDKVKILNINETSHVVQESRIMKAVSKVGLYKLNPVHPQLESARFPTI